MDTRGRMLEAHKEYGSKVFLGDVATKVRRALGAARMRC